MKSEMEKSESRELADAELDVVSGGSIWGFVAGAVGGAFGGVLYAARTSGDGRTLY